MSRYGKIESGFWQNGKVRALSERGRYLLTYLLSCPHGNAVGCFVLRNGYIADDLGWTTERVSETVSELSRTGFIERDQETFLLRIVGWWGHNEIANANVAKHIAKELNALPNCQVKQWAIADILSLENLHETVKQTLSERLPEPFRNQEHNTTQQEHEQEQSMNPRTPEASGPSDEELALVAYNATAKRYLWPEAQRLTETRRRSLKARLDDCGGLESWRGAMARAAKSDFLTGRAKRAGTHEGWKPNLDFFLQSSSFTKLTEGFYDNKGSAPMNTPVSDEQWRERFRTYQITGQWYSERWGDSPETGRCKAPAHIQQEFLQPEKLFQGSPH